jgi:hypothetical protein
MALALSAFDQIDRDLVGGAPYRMPHFEYLNRSNRFEADRVRTLVDAFLSRYPEVDQGRICDRLRLVDDIAHLGAFFELAVHELLVRAGCRAVAVEPPVEGTQKAPDFLVETPSGDRIYFEATLATDRSREDVGAQRRLDQAFKTIDSIPSPDFWAIVSWSGIPTAPITGKTLKQKLQQWLARLDHDEVSIAWQGGVESTQVLVYEEHSVRFRISPVPRPCSPGPTAPTRFIGIRMPDASWVQPSLAIRDAVNSKATRYGELDLPYVVAVNAMSEFAHEEDAVDALFGPLATIVRRTGGDEHEFARLPDGVWNSERKGPGEPTNTRVSAVLSTERLTPWTGGQQRARLIMNPWAKNPLPPELALGVDVLRLQGP